MGEHELWFDQPASTWNDALPIGNGTLGAMVFGGPTVSRFQVNDGRAWSGSPASESAEPQIEPEVAAAALARARSAIRARDFTAADEALRRIQHRYSQAYLPFAELALRITPHGPSRGTEVSNYRRSLDLSAASHRVEYLLGGYSLTQTAFASHAHGVLAIDIESEDPLGLDVSLELSSQLRVRAAHTTTDTRSLLLRMPSDVSPVHDELEEPVRYSNDDSLSMHGAVTLRVTHDGTTGHSILGARRIRVILATETTFSGIGRQPIGSAGDALRRADERVATAFALDGKQLRADHLRSHETLYSRVQLETGPGTELPTDQRMAAGSRPVLERDPGLAALLFNYGRYLLICSSREGGVPANLQGIWNPWLQPAWSANYTTNINLQMNYWLAEVANLPECLPPLFDLIDALVINGGPTARRLYDAAGWVAHHNTDVWAYSQPVGLGSHDPKWSFWPFAGAWLVRHLWSRIEHGADDDFVRDRAWVPIRGATEFFLDWLVERDDGTLGTIPSTSPENQFLTEEGVVASAAESSTNDLVCIAELFDILAAVAERLGRGHDPVVVRAAAARPRIPAPEISARGWVREWLEDFDFPDPHHRHLSHLYFLHPGGWAVEPELLEAARQTLDVRGDESPGWSLAWKLAMRARLRDATKASDLLALIFRDMAVDRGPWVGGMYPNLLSAHPPFSIDGNLGFVSGLAECLMQSHLGVIELLPAVPGEFPAGRVSGLVARTGVEVAVSWDRDELGRVRLGEASVTARHARAAGNHVLCYQGWELVVPVEPGSTSRATRSDFEVRGVRHGGVNHPASPATLGVSTSGGAATLEG